MQKNVGTWLQQKTLHYNLYNWAQNYANKRKKTARGTWLLLKTMWWKTVTAGSQTPRCPDNGNAALNRKWVQTQWENVGSNRETGGNCLNSQMLTKAKTKLRTTNWQYCFFLQLLINNYSLNTWPQMLTESSNVHRYTWPLDKKNRTRESKNFYTDIVSRDGPVIDKVPRCSTWPLFFNQKNLEFEFERERIAKNIQQHLNCCLEQ